MVPPVRTLLVCVMLVGAGCLAGPAVTDAPAESPSATSPTTTASPGAATPATDATVTVGTDCPYRLSVAVATASQRDRVDRRVAFADLDEARRQEFRAAREDGETELGDQLPETWGSPVLVEYEGETYHAVASVC